MLDHRVFAATLVHSEFAIEMGRLVFDNLKKVTLYLMPVSQCIIGLNHYLP